MSLPLTMHIKDLLETASVVTSSWPIFIGSEPDNPNECITLYDTPGSSPNPKFLLDYPRFLARVRSLSYEQGFAKAQELKEALLGLPSQDHDGIRLVGIWVVTDTHFLKADERGRSIFVNTWRMIVEPSEGVNRQPL